MGAELFEDWSDDAVSAVARAVANGMPEGAMALYARWWQLETWIRELIYVELRALYGEKWVDKVKAALGRQRQDAEFKHMSTADTENPLAYLDYSQLLPLVDSHWDQMGYALLEKKSWDGRQEELKRIRHRIGHVRRPHQDDLGRLQQTLRDLERGAFIACASYNRRSRPDPKKSSDPVTEGWLAGGHRTAQRLIRHAEVQYGVTLDVAASRRPWTAWPDSLENSPGVFWHADFFMRERTLDVAALWNQIRGISPLIVHALIPNANAVYFTFSAVDDPLVVSDAIGACFDSVLSSSRWDRRGDGAEFDKTEFRRWADDVSSIDYRIMGPSEWSLIDETAVPISIFAAGGGVSVLPSW
ncbi:Swt1 family HEPN domain-containing protein [Streptomyces sp. NPDC056543]|uniref:Swt1 family HEPN domain-containing protein n=1 Tax=unclassified Streptomyces TaxID=2593676 RepID=UPI00368E6A7D